MMEQGRNATSPAQGTLDISSRDVLAIAAAVESEVTSLEAGGIGNVRGVVDAIISRAASANDVGWGGRSFQGIINAPGQFTGISDAGGWTNYSRRNMPDRETVQAVKEGI